METVLVSPKYEIVIPPSLRDRLGITPGQHVQAIAYSDRIVLIPLRRAKELRGFVRGIDTSVPRCDFPASAEGLFPRTSV